ncbi:daunorubicin resistance ABC transporter ATPase subunit [Candidatus Magnetoovum chiemensis]|nr:daunorubicin resistance ABC transporter ATPase subunit [Candidatus Magnetoovum chiemensis]
MISHKTYESTQSVLNVVNLKKNYADKTAVNEISFSFNEGEFIGLLGPNGAGKTTTINMLTGLIKPTSGEVYYYGKDFFLHAEQTKNFIGVVPQVNNIDRDLTAYENLYHHAILYKMPKNKRKEKIEQSLEFAGLTEYKDKEARTFSGGTKRRLVIVRALLHEPRILFLDEPTVGLDPHIRRQMWDFIITINQVRKTTILLTTHYIEEAEKLCQKVLIIDKGKIIAQGQPNTLKKQIGNYVLEIFYEDRIKELFFKTKEEALNKLKDFDVPCKIRDVTLEDLFLTLTGNRINV